MTISFNRAAHTPFQFKSNTLEPMKDAPDSSSFLSGSVHCIGKNVQGTENNYIYINDVDSSTRNKMITAWENRRNVRLVISTVSVISAVGTAAVMLSGKLALSALTVSVIALLVIGAAIALFQALHIEATELQAWRKNLQHEIQILRYNAFRNPEILKDWIFQIGCVEDKESILIDGFTQEQADAYSHRYFTPSEKFWIWRHHTLDALNKLYNNENNIDGSKLKEDIDQLTICIEAVNPKGHHFANIHLTQTLFDQAQAILEYLNKEKDDPLYSPCMHQLIKTMNRIDTFDDSDFKNPRELKGQ